MAVSKDSKSNEGYIGPATADVRKIKPGIGTGSQPGPADSRGLPVPSMDHENLMDFNADSKLKPNKGGSGFVH